MKNDFRIGKRVLFSGQPPYMVAEIGVNHNGDFSLAKLTIDAAAEAGADAVKFQSFHAEEFVADRDMRYEYKSKDIIRSESMFEMFKRLEMPDEWHGQLQKYARKRGVEFLSSCADVHAVDLLLSLEAPALKISSEDLINIPLLKHVAGKRVPVILSTGMAEAREIEYALGILTSGGKSPLLLLHCVSAYPAPDEQMNLLRMNSLHETYGFPVGFSDHSRGIEAAVGATALGALLIEKHFTLDRSLSGPDHDFSSDPAEFRSLVESVKRMAKQRGTGNIGPSAVEEEGRKKFRRSLVATLGIPEGATVTCSMLGLKRPGDGISPRRIDDVIGRTAARAFVKDEKIDWRGLK